MTLTCVDVQCLQSCVKHFLNCLVSRRTDVSKRFTSKITGRKSLLFTLINFFESDGVSIHTFIDLMSNRKFWKPIDDRAYSNLKVYSPAATNHLDLMYMQLRI